MSEHKCLIIAEAGVNHNGCIETALKLCDEARRIGADVIKFQTWKTENIITANVPQAEYQAQNTGVTESQYDMLKRLELSYDAFKIIKRHCDSIGITFASTADDEESLDFLVSLGVPFLKVGSGDIGNVSFLRYIGSKRLPVICYPLTKEEFVSGLKEMHIGEWRKSYCAPHELDGTQWEMEIYFEGNRKAVRISGSNAFPYNFIDLKEFLEIDEEDAEDTEDETPFR